LAAAQADLDTTGLDVEAAIAGETMAHDRYREASTKAQGKVDRP
jgi:hypothetical protein